jgi:hypothetical protein
MRIQVIYGYCFPESESYQTLQGEIDGWTLNHITIPNALKSNPKALQKTNYYCHLVQGSAGVAIILKVCADDRFTGALALSHKQVTPHIDENAYAAYNTFLLNCGLDPSKYRPGIFIVSV